MGTAPSTNKEFELAKRHLTAQELQELERFFRSLAAQSRSGGQYIIASVFQAYFNIHGSLGARLFDVITAGHKDSILTFEDLVVAKARYEKGSPDDTEDFVFKMLDLTGDGYLTRQNVESAITSCLSTVLGTADSLDESCIQAIVNSGDFPERINSDSDAGNEPTGPSSKDGDGMGEASQDSKLESGLKQKGQGMRQEDKSFRSWLQRMPAVHKFLASLLSDPRSGTSIAGRQVPELTGWEGEAGGGDMLLRKELAWVLSGALPETHTQRWHLAYSSSIHGASFNSFLGRVSSMPGPSVLIVRDEEKCTFGGYASQPWERHSEFYGDMKSFLFTLLPCAAIYRPSGANANIQWCASGYQSESLPNGIGFGGQVDHFGLFLSDSFDQGHSRPALTFNSPQLSKHASFRPETVECWAVVLKQEESLAEQAKLSSQGNGGVAGPGAKQGTVLERFKEEKAMMNFMGLATSSDNVGPS